MAAPARPDCLAALRNLAAVMRQRVQLGLDSRRQRLDLAASRLARPTELLRREAQRLAMLQHRLAASVRHASLTNAQRERQAALRLHRAAAVLRVQHAQRLGALAARLDALGPRQVLARGYAWLSDARGVALTSAVQVRPGQCIAATLADGRLSASVLEVERSGDERS
jgi:exodeoxyribonuclease VII large subunit